MRSPRAVPAALTLIACAVPTAAGVLVASASAQTPPDACAQRLDTGSRQTHRFVAGGRALSWARLVVTATRADPDSYCVEIRFGGRMPSHRTSTTGYERRGGRWVTIGGDGGGAEPRRSYTQSLKIPARRRSDRFYEVRSGGRWYTATASLRNP